MNRDRADLVAGLVVAAVVGVGLLYTWNAYQTQRAYDSWSGGMMGGDGMMGSMMAQQTDPVWYLLGTLIVGVALGGGYLLLRNELDADVSAVEQAGTDGGTTVAESPDERSGTESTATADRPSILDVLPDDERRILEPVIESPGLTQIALRDRSDFSKSKVSQTVSELEKRGLLYREKQGRTYRVYPSDDLGEREDGS